MNLEPLIVSALAESPSSLKKLDCKLQSVKLEYILLVKTFSDSVRFYCFLLHSPPLQQTEVSALQGCLQEVAQVNVNRCRKEAAFAHFGVWSGYHLKT